MPLSTLPLTPFSFCRHLALSSLNKPHVELFGLVWSFWSHMMVTTLRVNEVLRTPSNCLSHPGVTLANRSNILKLHDHHHPT